MFLTHSGLPPCMEVLGRKEAKNHHHHQSMPLFPAGHPPKKTILLTPDIHLATLHVYPNGYQQHDTTKVVHQGEPR